ncbi:hypothetical protein BH10BDE1_BH10BDE1_01890 [soil metagenome]
MKRHLVLLTLAFLTISLKRSTVFAQSCEGLFKTAHVEEFMRFSQPELEHQVRNRAAQASLILKLKRLLPAGAYDADVNGRSEGLSVRFDPAGSVQLRLSSGHVTQSQSTPFTQSQWGGVRGSRSGLGVQFQFLPGEKLVITNTILSGDENTYLGLTKRELRAEFDLSAGPITQIQVQETVTVTSVYRQEDTTYTVPTTVKILQRR